MFALLRTSSITDGIVKCLRIDPFEERMKIVRNAKRRSNCFKVTHFASGCMQKSGCYIEGCTGKHMTVFHPPERYLQTRRSNGTNNDDVKEASPNNQSNVRDASDHTSPNHAIGAGVCKPGSTILDLDLNPDVLPIERTLGFRWNMDSDMFTIKIVPKDEPFTRRGILSVTSPSYDPLGMVSPITLQAEKFLQDLCKKGLT